MPKALACRQLSQRQHKHCADGDGGGVCFKDDQDALSSVSEGVRDRCISLPGFVRGRRHEVKEFAISSGNKKMTWPRRKVDIQTKQSASLKEGSREDAYVFRAREHGLFRKGVRWTSTYLVGCWSQSQSRTDRVMAAIILVDW
jgi:hypothetical protein